MWDGEKKNWKAPKARAWENGVGKVVGEGVGVVVGEGVGVVVGKGVGIVVGEEDGVSVGIIVGTVMEKKKLKASRRFQKRKKSRGGKPPNVSQRSFFFLHLGFAIRATPLVFLRPRPIS